MTRPCHMLVRQEEVTGGISPSLSRSCPFDVIFGQRPRAAAAAIKHFRQGDRQM